MARYSGITNTIAKWGKNIKEFFSGDGSEAQQAQEDQTLNQQINTGAINTPAVTTPTQGNTLNLGGFSKPTLNQEIESNNLQSPNVSAEEIIQSPSLDSRTVGFLSVEDTDTTGDVSAKLAKEKEEEKESGWKSFGNWVKNVYSGAEDLYNSIYAKREAKQQEKHVALGYNEDNGDLLFLDLTNRGGEDEIFSQYQNEFESIVSNPNSSEEEIYDAMVDFYNNTKGMFRLRSDDYYSGGRWKNQYSQEQLDSLSANGTKKGDYVPTIDEFYKYIQTTTDNAVNAQNIYGQYGLLNEDDDTVIDLSTEARSKWTSGWNSVALAGVTEAAQQYLNPTAATKAVLAIADASRDQRDRIYNIVAPVYAAEKVVLAKDPSERTDGEKELLDIANRFRGMERAAAEAINNWAIQEIKYGIDENGQISQSLDMFENGQTLSDVLTSEVKRLAGDKNVYGLKTGWADFQSNIDVFNVLADRALYDYQKGKGWRGGRAWAGLQKALAPVGWGLAEVGQQGTKLLLNTVNTITAPISGYDPEEGLSATSKYLDQDFTIGRLIETDDGKNSRVIKKYLLQLAEYTPEIAGNLIPDILLDGVPLIRHIGDANKVAKAVKAINAVDTVDDIASAVNNVSRGLKGIEKTTAVANNLRNSTKRRTIGDIALYGLERFGKDQMMEAHRSGFDTERYSTASQIWSLGGTVMTELLPIFWKADVVDGVKKLMGVENLGKSGEASIWDVADFMGSSEEAANLVASALGKEIKNISFEDLKQFSKTFGSFMDGAKSAYDELDNMGKTVANKWTKDVMYDYVKQAFGSNSEVAKKVRAIVANNTANPADIIKYLGKIPGTVSIGPYISTIKLKQGTQAIVSGKYDESLDILQGGFASRINNGFTNADIENISKIADYADIKTTDGLFKEIDGKKYLTEEGYRRFNLDLENMSLESLGVSLASVEETKELFKDRLKSITNKGKAIKDSTIDEIAETGAYDEVVDKVKEIVC